MSSELKTYRIKVCHDNGITIFKVKAINYASAIKILTTSEKCPESAIKSITTVIK